MYNAHRRLRTLLWLHRRSLRGEWRGDIHIFLLQRDAALGNWFADVSQEPSSDNKDGSSREAREWSDIDLSPLHSHGAVLRLVGLLGGLSSSKAADLRFTNERVRCCVSDRSSCWVRYVCYLVHDHHEPSVVRKKSFAESQCNALSLMKTTLVARRIDVHIKSKAMQKITSKNSLLAVYRKFLQGFSIFFGACEKGRKRPITDDMNVGP